MGNLVFNFQEKKIFQKNIVIIDFQYFLIEELITYHEELCIQFSIISTLSVIYVPIKKNKYLEI
jgi:hypothetical protein